MSAVRGTLHHILDPLNVFSSAVDYPANNQEMLLEECDRNFERLANKLAVMDRVVTQLTAELERASKYPTIALKSCVSCESLQPHVVHYRKPAPPFGVCLTCMQYAVGFTQMWAKDVAEGRK